MKTNHNNDFIGNCVIDYTTLDSVIHCLDFCCSDYNWFIENHYYFDSFYYQIRYSHDMKCLINFVEALILQENIFVPFLSSCTYTITRMLDSQQLGHHRPMPNYFKELHQQGIIRELPVDRKISQQLITAYEKHAKSEVFARKISGSIRNIGRLSTYDEILRISSSSSGNPFFKWNDFANEPDLNLQFQVVQEHLAKGNLNYLLKGDPKPLLHKLIKFILRGLAYNDFAKLESVPYLPHPLRLVFSMSEGLWSHKRTREWGTIAVRYMNDFRRDFASAIGDGIFDLDIPLLFAAVIRECNSRKEIIPTALEMRETSEAKAFRNWNKDITKALYDNDGRRVGKALKELKDLKRRLLKEFGFETDKFTANLWIISYDIKIPQFLHALSNELIGGKHIQFLHDYATRGAELISLKNELERVFFE